MSLKWRSRYLNRPFDSFAYAITRSDTFDETYQKGYSHELVCSITLQSRVIGSKEREHCVKMCV